MSRPVCFVEAVHLSWEGPPRASARPLCFRAQPGHLVWLSGPSGSGKSTLLSVILGLQDVKAGQLLRGVGDARVGASDGALSAWRRRVVGVVPQGTGLIDGLSVDDHLRLMNVGEARRTSVCERFGLSDRREARAETLSGGEARRACVARALAAKPAVLVLDEPTAGLDAAAASEVWRAVAEAAAEGAAVVVASHDEGIADAVGAQAACRCQRVVLEAPGGR